MDRKNVIGHRHRRSPSSDRFLGVFPPPSADRTISSSPSAVELNEDDVFYTNDFSEPKSGPTPTVNHRSRHSFRQPEKFGILAALPEDHKNPDVIIQKPAFPPASPTTSLSRDFPAIPKPQSSSEMKYSQSMPIRRFQQSAPVSVPMMARKPRNGDLADVDLGDDMDDVDEVLPPHEIVARGSWRNEKTAYSVLEGVGRTLKGRDLRQVRNAVWRQTGFLD